MRGLWRVQCRHLLACLSARVLERGVDACLLVLRSCLRRQGASGGEFPAVQFRSGMALVWDNGDYLNALAGARYDDDDRHDFLRHSISDDCWDFAEETPCLQGAGDSITCRAMTTASTRFSEAWSMESASSGTASPVKLGSS